MRLNTFEQVEKHYNSIKPLVSKYHTRADDLRPIGRRDRKWEHIEKVNDNNYILHDAIKPSKSGHWSNVFYRNPPITWERRGNNEFVTVRGCVGPYLATSRFAFLREYLPVGLWFDNHRRSGFHFINKEFLPRPAQLLGADKQWDGAYLTFRSRLPKKATVSVRTTINLSGRGYETNHLEAKYNWELVSDRYFPPKKKVNKEKKAALREDIEAFWLWMCVNGPLLKVYDRDFGTRMREEALAVINDANLNLWNFAFPAELALEIVKDYHHTLRISLAYDFLVRHDIRSLETKEDKKKFRSAFNRWANETFGLIETSSVTKAKG